MLAALSHVTHLASLVSKILLTHIPHSIPQQYVESLGFSAQFIVDNWLVCCILSGKGIELTA